MVDEVPLKSAAASGGTRRRTFLRGVGVLGAYSLAGGGVGSLISSCSVPSASTKAGAKTISVGVFQNPDSLDPGATGLITATQILYSIFDPLMWKVAGHDGLYPGLAERYTASPDARVYTFYLKRNVKFHDGTPLTAEAVKATFDHIVNPATQSRSAIGALGPYKETRVLDDYTAQVVFSEPNAAFVNEMTDATLAISSPTALKKYGKDYGVHPVGTGPFVFQTFVSNEQVVVTRNPDYTWGPSVLSSGPAKIDSLTFRILPDPSSQQNALTTGEIVIAENLNPGDVVSDVQNGKKKFTAPSTGMPYCLLVNAQRPPTNSLQVRQALQYATDQKTIIDTLFQGLYTPASSVITPVTPGYSPSQAIYSYDPAKAGQLLDAAGWRMGPGGVRSKGGARLSINLINISAFGFDNISALLQSQFHSVGIDVTISDQAFPAVATTYNQGTQNLADWFYYDVDPYLLNTVFNSSQIKSGFNWGHYDNPSVDAAITAANADINTASRVQRYQQIGLTLMQSATTIPIYNLESILVTAPNVSGIQFSLTAQPLFHGVQV
jgi:peptide/nickel transport system substrate-binding protein